MIVLDIFCAVIGGSGGGGLVLKCRVEKESADRGDGCADAVNVRLIATGEEWAAGRNDCG